MRGERRQELLAVRVIGRGWKGESTEETFRLRVGRNSRRQGDFVSSPVSSGVVWCLKDLHERLQILEKDSTGLKRFGDCRVLLSLH